MRRRRPIQPIQETTMMVLIKHAGFSVGVNFARAKDDLPVRELRFVGNDAFGVMDPQPKSGLVFMRGPGPIHFVTKRHNIAAAE
jgi:hypothetical protein